MLKAATQEAEREALARISLEYLAGQGCRVETRTSSDGEVVTVLGVVSGKEVSIAIDQENHILADFSQGYESFAAGTCDRDLASYLSALADLGVGVEVDYCNPKTPTRRSKDAKRIPKAKERGVDPSVL